MSILKLENEDLVMRKDGRILLKNITFIIENGDKVLFSGINGAGKSTLFKTLLNFTSEEGDIYAELKNGKYTFCDSEKLENLNQHIIYIAQEDFVAKPFTRVENALLQGIPDKISNKKKFLKNWIEKYKPFIQDDVNKKLLKKRILSLSGGEKKFVSIIQCLLRCDFPEVKLALIDEPINNLDAKHIIHFSDLLTRIQFYNPNFSLVIITHCHAFPKITKAYEIQGVTLKRVEYQTHNCFGHYDANGYYQSWMNPETN